MEREKNIDYSQKIYLNPIQEKEGVRPHLQEMKTVAKYVFFSSLITLTEASKLHNDTVC